MSCIKKFLLSFFSLFLLFSLIILMFSSVSFTIKLNNEVNQYNGVYWLDFPVSSSSVISEVGSIAVSSSDEKFMLSNFKINSYLFVNGIDFNKSASSNILNLSKPLKDLKVLHAKFSSENMSPTKTPLMFILCMSFMISILLTLAYIVVKFIMNNCHFFTQDIAFISSLQFDKFTKFWVFITKNWLGFCVIVFLASRLWFIINFKLLTLFYHGISFPASMSQWDVGYYCSIVKSGYLHSSVIDFTKYTNLPFFPAFPAVIKLIVNLGGDFLISAITFNQIINFLSVIILYDYLRMSSNKNVASYGALLFAFSPAAVYFMSPYTEALFIFLSLVTVNLLYREKFFYAAVVCGILTATRVVGNIMPLVILFVYSFNYFVKEHQKFNFKFLLKFTLITLVSFSGLIIFMLYLRYITGDYLAFYHAQKAWHKPDPSGWFNPILALFGLLFRSGNLIDLVFFFLSLWIGWVLYVYKRYNELLFFVGCCLIPIVAQSLDSYARFMLSNYSFYIALPLFAAQRKVYHGVFLALFMIAMQSYLVVWVSGYLGIQ